MIVLFKTILTFEQLFLVLELIEFVKGLLDTPK
jgi:hypothetical protein